MKETYKMLKADYDAASQKIKDIGTNTDTNAQIYYEERDKIRNEIIKLKLGEKEVNVKLAQIKAEDKREKDRLISNLVQFGISTGVGIVFGWWTFTFDEHGTVTSTLGRPVLNSFLPKMLRR